MPSQRWLGLHAVAVRVHSCNPNIEKTEFARQIASHFSLEKGRSIYSGGDFGVRFCYSNNAGFSNVVVSLAALLDHDDKPFLVCLLQPSGVKTYIANTTFIKKISHSSQGLTIANIRGSFLGHDILRELNGLENIPANFENLYSLHAEIPREDNIARIVEATTNISPTGVRFNPSPAQVATIISSVETAARFYSSPEFSPTEDRLIRSLNENRDEIMRIGLVDNVNLRGNRIEQLLTGTGNRHSVQDSCVNHYGFRVLVDYKTKILTKNSAPKFYNVDKVLQELAIPNTVLCALFIGINPDLNTVQGKLVNFFDERLLPLTRVQMHWAGRNSRGVTQISGDLSFIFERSFRGGINADQARAWLQQLIA